MSKSNRELTRMTVEICWCDGIVTNEHENTVATIVFPIQNQTHLRNLSPVLLDPLCCAQRSEFSSWSRQGNSKWPEPVDYDRSSITLCNKHSRVLTDNAAKIIQQHERPPIVCCETRLYSTSSIWNPFSQSIGKYICKLIVKNFIKCLLLW